MKLIAELRRRKVFRAAMVYVAASWFLLGVFNLAFESWSMPDQTLRYVWFAVLLGFPIAMVLVWLYDITDDGLVRTSPSSSDEQPDLKLHRSDYVILTIFVSVLGVIAYQLTTNIMGVKVDQMEAELSEAPAGSIAVLPFEDVSPGGDQAYLGNGIADELRLELQRLDGLRVAGRTSSIAYTQQASKTISEFLNVGSILEGSVRKEGDNVRITVQLTNAADGFTIWSESYNRALENIFEMQEQIATAVAGALGVRLGVGGVNAFRGAGTQNVDAYEAYLQAHNQPWTLSGGKKAIRLLERAIELDPNYGAAWSLLGLKTLSAFWDVSPDQVPEIVDRAYPHVLRGMQLNPESGNAQSILGIVRVSRFDWIGAEQSHTRGIELLADRLVVASYGMALMRNGRSAYAEQQYNIAKSLEPLDGRPFPLAWHTNLAQGQIAEAKESSNWQDAANLIENNLDIAFNERDPEALKAAIAAMAKTDLAYIELYAPVLAEFDTPERILSIVRDVYRDENLQWLRKTHDIAMVAAYFGDPQFALKVKGQEVRSSTARLAALWYPVMSEARQLPEFKKLVTELNLVEYWRAYGWADHCRPLGDDDFECS